MKIYQIENWQDFQKFHNLYSYEGINDYQVFQSYDFLQNYLKFFNHKKYKIIIYIDGNKFLILPLYEFRYFTFKYIGFVGSPYLSEQNDIIHNINDKKELFKVLDKIFIYLEKRNIKNFYFNNLKKNFFVDYLISINFTILSNQKLNLCSMEDGIFFDEKTKNKENNKIDFKIRKFSKNITQKLKPINNIHYMEENFSNEIKDFIISNKKLNFIYKKKFIENLNFIIHLHKNTKLIILNELKIDNEIVSLILGFIFKNNFYYSIPVYNNIYNKYSFGKYHLRDFLKASDNFKHIIFGPGPEIYKKKFKLTDDRLITLSNDKKMLVVKYLKNIFSDKKINK